MVEEATEVGLRAANAVTAQLEPNGHSADGGSGNSCGWTGVGAGWKVCGYLLLADALIPAWVTTTKEHRWLPTGG